MPGIKDVARRAGVGVATVSRVINNSGYVSEETKDKIEKHLRSKCLRVHHSGTTSLV